MALQGSKGNELWCMVSTPVSDFYVRGKSGMSKVQSGVYTVHEYNFHEAVMHAGHSATHDIDEQILKKVWLYRFPLEEVPLDYHTTMSARLVHSWFQTSRPDLAGTEILVKVHISAPSVRRATRW